MQFDQSKRRDFIADAARASLAVDGLADNGAQRLQLSSVAKQAKAALGAEKLDAIAEVADGDVLPRWILRQPLAERVVDRQFSRRLELEDHCHGERLRDASHLIKRVLVDGPCVEVAAHLPGEGSIAGPAAPKLI